mmetsp:Transcript_4469/g.7837  ORF Transcript_4469/g.7837 Transcript_4469/m.7837 type:complete len:90 (-) Transcript_4469:21-290(-)
MVNEWTKIVRMRQNRETEILHLHQGTDLRNNSLFVFQYHRTFRKTEILEKLWFEASVSGEENGRVSNRFHATFYCNRSAIKFYDNHFSR